MVPVEFHQTRHNRETSNESFPNLSVSFIFYVSPVYEPAY